MPASVYYVFRQDVLAGHKIPRRFTIEVIGFLEQTRRKWDNRGLSHTQLRELALPKSMRGPPHGASRQGLLAVFNPFRAIMNYYGGGRAFARRRGPPTGSARKQLHGNTWVC